MDGKKTCRGCGTVVVKPIICDFCGIASHPACLPRTGHSHQGGKFLNCSAVASGGQVVRQSDIGSDSFLEKIRKMIRDEIRSEFADFRKEILETYKADIEKVNNNIQQLSDRIDKLESHETNLKEAPLSQEEDILLEMAEREKRSRNIIFFNMDEAEHAAEAKDSDMYLAKDILQAILPNETPEVKVTRLGVKRRGHPRPLRITLRSKNEAISILRNKGRYSGPVKIVQDQTIKQRNHWRNLKAQLKLLLDRGENKTIRYFEGVPKIVDARINSKSKNF